MNNYIFKYSILLVILVLIQVLICNNMYLFGYINPLIYILFVFVYPIKENKNSLLLFSFILGLLIDFFSNSGGSNTAAIVFIAYFRLSFLKLIQNNIEFDYLLFNIKKLNFPQMIVYVFSLTFLHHLILFYLEYYTLKTFGSILLNVLYTSVFSSVLISFAISLFVKNKNS